MATVDRVLHGRGTTSPLSIDAVRAAIAELDRQQASTELGTRTLSIEAVVAADAVRVRQVRDRLHQLRPRLRPRVVHTFVRTVPGGDPELAAATLARVCSRRPRGVLVDLADDAVVVEQAARLLNAGIPVVTTHRAFPRHASLGHSGLDDRAAGSTAAYLVARSEPSGVPFVVAHGPAVTPAELVRIEAFSATVRELRPGATLTTVALDDVERLDLQGHGGLYVTVDGATPTFVHPGLRERLRQNATIVGHRDAALPALVSTRFFDFALDVDWEAVVSEACRALLGYHRRGLGQVVVSPTPPSVLTPYNLQR